jgi:GntR family transcriptional regulator
MVQSSANTPLYSRIASVLRQRIDNGELAVGEMLPTLEQCMLDFGASRITMRQAMDLLESEQLISRRRGYGTVVIARPVSHSRVGLPNTWNELLARLEHISRTQISVETSRQPTEDELNIDAHPSSIARAKSRLGAKQSEKSRTVQHAQKPERYVRMVARHDHGATAYCHVDAWLDSDLYRQSRRALKSRPTLQHLVEAHPDRIACVLQSTTIAVADIAISASLLIPIGSPIALVRRTVFDANARRIYASRISFPASIVRWDAALVTDSSQAKRKTR